MAKDEDLAQKEYEIKRLEFVRTTLEASIERMFKASSIALAGNVAAIGACALGFKDYRAEIGPAIFEHAIDWFAVGAIAGALCLGLCALVGEIAIFMFMRIAARDFLATDIQSFMQQQITSHTTAKMSVSFIVLCAPFLVSAFSFFYGVSYLTSAIK